MGNFSKENVFIEVYRIQDDFVAKCQCSSTGTVLWCQVRSSHIHANHKAIYSNNSKRCGERSQINKYLKNPTNIKYLKYPTNVRATDITSELPHCKVYLVKMTVFLLKAIVEIIHNKLTRLAYSCGPLSPCFIPSCDE